MERVNQILVKQEFDKGTSVEYYSIPHGMWVEEQNPKWNSNIQYRVRLDKLSYYPRYYKAINSDLVVKFTDRNSGEVVVSDDKYNTGMCGSWHDHEDDAVWKLVKNPDEVCVITNNLGQVLSTFNNQSDASMFLSYFKSNINNIKQYLNIAEANIGDLRVDTILKERK